MARGGMPQEWFYLYHDTEYGPIPARRLRLMLEFGSDDPDRRFRPFGSRRWLEEDAVWAFVINAEKGVASPEQYIDSFHEERRPLFHPVSKRKYLMMSLSTSGVYFLIWVYRTWKSLKKLYPSMSPLLQTMLLPINDGALILQTDDCLADTLGREPKGPFRIAMSLTLWSKFSKFAILLALLPYCQVFILAPLFYPILFLPTIDTINDANAIRTPECIPDDEISTAEYLWITISIAMTVGIVVLFYHLYYTFVFVRFFTH